MHHEGKYRLRYAKSWIRLIIALIICVWLHCPGVGWLPTTHIFLKLSLLHRHYWKATILRRAESMVKPQKPQNVECITISGNCTIMECFTISLYGKTICILRFYHGFCTSQNSRPPAVLGPRWAFFPRRIQTEQSHLTLQRVWIDHQYPVQPLALRRSRSHTCIGCTVLCHSEALANDFVQFWNLRKKTLNKSLSRRLLEAVA